MKIIGIDARLYSQTGVGVYLRNLIEQLQLIDDKDIQYNIYVLSGDKTNIHAHSSRIHIIEVPYRWHTFSEQIGFLKKLYHDKLDLMHFTYFSYPIGYMRPFMVTMHDTVLLHNRTGKATTGNPILYIVKHWVFRYVFWSQLHHSLKIIVPTNTVKKQIIMHYGNRYKHKIEVVYEGVDSALQNVQESATMSSRIPIHYFLYVGNFYPHKNVESLIKALKMLPSSIKFVLVGPEGFFLNRIRALAVRMHVENRIIYMSNASLSDLAYIYKHALALVHPSYEEGFGLPLLEAVYFNIPIIASDIAVFHELLQDHFLSFNPHNKNDIATKLSLFLEKPFKPHYNNLLDRFDFTKMAYQTHTIYRSLLFHGI